MQQLVIIVGNGGAGKKTTGQLLYSKLARASWTHMRWMTALQIWEPTPRFDDLLLRNAAAVIGNYLDEGVDQAILSGGVFTQGQLDRLLELLNRPLEVRYFWLDIPNAVRAERLVRRARDSGDSPDTVKELIAKFSSPIPTLKISAGTFEVIDTAALSPERVVDQILANLQQKGA